MPDSKTLTIEEQHDLLQSGRGFVELVDQCFIGLTGDDRHAFLHNFCTADTKKLASSQTCEAMVLNTKGKILGFVNAVATEDELLLTGNDDQAPKIIEHLDKYLIREDVELKNRTGELAGIFVCLTGNTSDLLANVLGSLPEQNQCFVTEIGNISARVCHLELAGFGIFIVVEKSNLGGLKTLLTNASFEECSVSSLDIIRVENKTPWFGVDADETNLPQELQRDEKAISFVKGCYLGQETVARIDAIGQVNQLLVSVKFTADCNPTIGMEFKDGEKVIGRVTSVANSPQHGPIGLAYVRRKFAATGTDLKTATVQ